MGPVIHEPTTSTELDLAHVPTFSNAERDRRWDLGRQLMDDLGLTALLVFGDREGSFPAPFAADTYFTNDRPGSIVVFPRDAEPMSVVAFPMAVMDHMQAVTRRENVWIRPENIFAGKRGEAVVEILQHLHLNRSVIGVIGLEPYPPYYFDGAMPYNTWHTILESFPDATFRPVQRQFLELSARRSAEELAVLRWSAQVGETMCEAMRDATRPGVTEADIYAAGIAACPRHAGFTTMMLLGSGREYFTWGLPTWTYRPHRPRVIADGDIVLAEVFCSLGMLETQHQPTIAVGDVHPDFSRAAWIARESYEAGLAALRPGRRFGDVVLAMEKPVRQSDGWHVHPWVHSLNPFGLISGMPDPSPALSGAERYGRVGAIPFVGEDVVLKPGMTFALEPNCALGKRVVNLGGTVIVGVEAPVELNELATHLIHV